MTYNTIRLLTLPTILILTLLTIFAKIITLLINLAQQKKNNFYSIIILLAFTLTIFEENIRTLALGVYTMTV